MNRIHVAAQVTEPPGLVLLDQTQRLIESFEYIRRRDIGPRVFDRDWNSSNDKKLNLAHSPIS